MDEPCSALDPGSTLRIEETIKELAEKITVVIVTHNMQQASRVSDYCAFFLTDGGPGYLVEADKTRTMFTTPTDSRTADYVQGKFG
jgi:phosphate transport system ATP-binding protein